MKTLHKFMLVVGLVILCFGVAACSGKKQDLVDETEEGGTMDVPAEVSDAGFLWQYYFNERFSYLLPYPYIFDDQIDSDNGDGVRMISDDLNYELITWGEYNVTEDTAEKLLEIDLKNNEDISESLLIGNSFTIVYNVEENGIVYEVVKKGCVNGEQQIFYTLRYPLTERDSFIDINERMKADFNLD